MLALFDYKTEWGMVRGFYQVINTSSYGGYYEVFMGKDASIEISENITKGAIFPEPVAKPKKWLDEATKIEKEGATGVLVTVGTSLQDRVQAGVKKDISKTGVAKIDKPPHLLHLENFFGAIREPQKVKLSCPGEVGFETCVSVLKANEALAKGSKVNYDPKEFVV